jgi:excisionase family DNA binding protein
MSKEPLGETLFTEEEIAKYLGKSTRTIQEWRKEHRGPLFVQIGRTVRYRKNDVVKWVANQLPKGGSHEG